MLLLFYQAKRLCYSNNQSIYAIHISFTENNCFVYNSHRNGCATSEDMLWKLEALQTFVCDLHWPDEVFAEHVNHRLRSMSTEMIEAAANRYVLYCV